MAHDIAWTAAEVSILREGRQAGLTAKEMTAQLPKRTERAIRHCWRKLGLAVPTPPSQAWTAGELQVLHDGARAGMVAEQIMDRLPKRSKDAIRNKLTALGLARPKPTANRVKAVRAAPQRVRRTEEQLAPIRAARWDGASMDAIAAMLGCGSTEHARKVCARYNILMSPEARGALNKINGALGARASRCPREPVMAVVVMRPKAQVSVEKPAQDFVRNGGEALPAGSVQTWGLISAAPWPRYEPIQGGTHATQ